MNASPLTILLVEDDPNDVFLIQRAFNKANMVHSIKSVADGEQAMAYLGGQGDFEDRAQFPLPTLILLDLKLPRKSGLEVLAWIRAQKGAIRRVPIIVLTSSKQSTDINRAYELGANSYLVKPVAFEGLLQVVQTLDLYWIVLNERPEV
ncbi:MAG TPA: response regulator [Candidatus Saccharimonadales bacterium]|nr:response regulator [Candidatus Saccharimonadales bacterium]